jgi:hypothetical protein
LSTPPLLAGLGESSLEATTVYGRGGADYCRRNRRLGRRLLASALLDSLLAPAAEPPDAENLPRAILDFPAFKSAAQSCGRRKRKASPGLIAQHVIIVITFRICFCPCSDYYENYQSFLAERLALGKGQVRETEIEWSHGVRSTHTNIKRLKLAILSRRITFRLIPSISSLRLAFLNVSQDQVLLYFHDRHQNEFTRTAKALNIKTSRDIKSNPHDTGKFRKLSRDLDISMCPSIKAKR